MAASHELRTPNRNRRGERTRGELLDAAWRIVDRMSLVELFAGLTPAAVASEAGMTTGAFRHHFETPDQLVRAMVDAHLDQVDWQTLDRVAANVDTGVRFDGAVVRTMASELWEVESSPAQSDRRRRRVLMSLRSGPTVFASGERLGDLVVDGFWAPYFAASVPLVHQALTALGRQCIPPFSEDDLVRVLRALLDGLQAQSTLQPGSVDAALYANVLTGLLVTLTVPAGRDESLADVEAALRAPSARADMTDLIQIQASAIAALGLFDRNVNDVTFSQVSSLTGIPIDELIRRYGTVRRVAATAFSAVLPRVEESALRHLAPEPMRALADSLCDVARMAKRYPHVAAALLFERSEQALTVDGRGGDPAGTSTDIRAVVPVADVVMRVLSHVEGLGRLDLAAVAADMVDLTLLFGGTRASWSPADVARRAIALLPF